MNLTTRKEERKPSKGALRIYTSVSICAYTVEIRDISKTSAFVRSKHIPEINETITYSILDKYGRVQMTGNGKVIRIDTQAIAEEIGFAISLQKEIPDQILSDLIIQ